MNGSRSVLIAAVFAGLAVGCGAVDYDRVAVRVIDGDTGRPVPHARVVAPTGQWGARGQTVIADGDGRANIRVARYVGGGVRAEPAGYLPSVNYRNGPSGTGDVVARVFRPPEPIAGLTVPDDFRGELWVQEGAKVATQPADLPLLNGRREFYTATDRHALTRLAAPPALYDAQPYPAIVYCARFADGRRLRFANPTASLGFSGSPVAGLPDLRDDVPPAADGVALFDLGTWIGSPGNARIFFVGTATDAAAAQQRWLDRDGGPTTRPALHSTGFRAAPLSIDAMPVNAEIAPRRRSSPMSPAR